MEAMLCIGVDVSSRTFHNGKPKMVAIVAVMRKIVVIANAKVRTLDRHATG